MFCVALQTFVSIRSSSRAQTMSSTAADHFTRTGRRHLRQQTCHKCQHTRTKHDTLKRSDLAVGVHAPTRKEILQATADCNCKRITVRVRQLRQQHAQTSPSRCNTRTFLQIETCSLCRNPNQYPCWKFHLFEFSAQQESVAFQGAPFSPHRPPLGDLITFRAQVTGFISHTGGGDSAATAVTSKGTSLQFDTARCS